MSIPLGRLALDNLRWWEKVLDGPGQLGTSFDLLLKHPSDGDIHIYTDACTELGGGGFILGLGPIRFFQVKWSDTNYGAVLKYRDLDISVLELLMAVVAIKTILPQLHNQSVSIFNDNPGAAGAIRNKAPPLCRMDLQALIEDF